MVVEFNGKIMSSSKFEKCLLKVCHIKAGSFHPWKIRGSFILGFYGCSSTGFIFLEILISFVVVGSSRKPRTKFDCWHSLPPHSYVDISYAFVISLYSLRFSKPILIFKRWLCSTLYTIEPDPFLYLKPYYINVIWLVDKIWQDFTFGQMWGVWQRSVGEDISQDALWCINHTSVIVMHYNVFDKTSTILHILLREGVKKKCPF